MDFFGKWPLVNRPKYTKKMSRKFAAQWSILQGNSAGIMSWEDRRMVPGAGSFGGWNEENQVPPILARLAERVFLGNGDRGYPAECADGVEWLTTKDGCIDGAERLSSGAAGRLYGDGPSRWMGLAADARKPLSDLPVDEY